VLFPGLELGLLDTDDHGKKLVLKTAFSDNEVNDCALSGSLGLVMGVNQLGLNVELEGSCNFDFLTSELNHKDLTLLGELSGEERIENGVNILANSVNHESLARADGELNLLLPMVSGELDGDHLTTFFTTDPLDSLKLRVNK
jgi:hypothetical protein